MIAVAHAEQWMPARQVPLTTRYTSLDEFFFTFIGSDVRTEVPVSFGGDLDIFKHLLSFLVVLLFDN